VEIQHNLSTMIPGPATLESLEDADHSDAEEEDVGEVAGERRREMLPPDSLKNIRINHQSTVSIISIKGGEILIQNLPLKLD